MADKVWEFPCSLIENYDGDTFKISVRLPLKISTPGAAQIIEDFGFRLYLKNGQLYHTMTVRLTGVDTPEMRGGTALTKAAAMLARDKAAEFLRSNYGHITFVSQTLEGRYGRTLGDFKVKRRAFPSMVREDQLLSVYLLAEKYALPYNGRKATLAQHEANAAALADRGLLRPYLEG